MKTVLYRQQTTEKASSWQSTVARNMLIEAHFPTIALVWGESPSAPTPASLSGFCLAL